MNQREDKFFIYIYTIGRSETENGLSTTIINQYKSNERLDSRLSNLRIFKLTHDLRMPFGPWVLRRVSKESSRTLRTNQHYSQVAIARVPLRGMASL